MEPGAVSGIPVGVLDFGKSVQSPTVFCQFVSKNFESAGRAKNPPINYIDILVYSEVIS